MIQFWLKRNNETVFFLIPICVLIVVSVLACGKKEYLTKSELNRVDLTIERATEAQQKLIDPTLQNAQIGLKVIQDANLLISPCLAKTPPEAKEELEKLKQQWDAKVMKISATANGPDMNPFYTFLGEALQQTIDILHKMKEIDTQQ